MPRRAPLEFTLNEQGGDRFATLAEAQRAALPFLAADMTATLLALIERGDLKIEGGRIVLAHPLAEGFTHD